MSGVRKAKVERIISNNEVNVLVMINNPTWDKPSQSTAASQEPMDICNIPNGWFLTVGRQDGVVINRMRYEKVQIEVQDIHFSDFRIVRSLSLAIRATSFFASAAFSLSVRYTNRDGRSLP